MRHIPRLFFNIIIICEPITSVHTSYTFGSKATESNHGFTQSTPYISPPLPIRLLLPSTTANYDRLPMLLLPIELNDPNLTAG